jgi:hypothetical protein
MDNDETDDLGGANTSLSVKQAAAAYAKTIAAKEPQGQPAADDDEQGDTADDLSAEETGDDPEADGEDTGNPDDEGQADDEADAEPESDQGRFVASNGKVRLPDGTVSTVADLIQGNLRDRDYRQKTMEAAELRKAAEAQSSALSQKEQQLTEQLNYANALLQSFMPQAPDPSKLETDPLGYMRDREQYERMSQHLAYIAQTQQGMTQQQRAEQEQQRQRMIQTEHAKLLDALPYLKDQNKLRSFASDIQTFGPKWGLTNEDIAALPTNHAYAVIIDKAIRWDKLQASKPKVQKQIENRPPVARGGKRPTPQENQARHASELRAKAKTSGRVEDAALAYLATRSG